MSMMQSFRKSYSDYDREYFCEVNAHAIFSAFFCAIQYRRDNSGMTQKELARRTGKDKSTISKMMNGPANWNLKTAAEMAFALDLEVEIVLVDKSNINRTFTPSGIVQRHRNNFSRFRQIIPSMPDCSLSNQVNVINPLQSPPVRIREARPRGVRVSTDRQSSLVQNPDESFRYLQSTHGEL